MRLYRNCRGLIRYFTKVKRKSLEGDEPWSKTTNQTPTIPVDPKMTSKLARKQTQNIIYITFWSQFASYALNSIMILFLTRPLYAHGLNYSQAHAYTFMGVTQATGYLIPIIGGYVADHILGIRRSILIGSILLACAYLLVMLSGFTLPYYGDFLFILAYALLPMNNALLTGSSSALVANIYADEVIAAKSAMTWYYLSINVGSLLAILMVPSLLDSQWGPLSILAITFIGKSIAALNFASHYSIYQSVIKNQDLQKFTYKHAVKLCLYFICVYIFTLFIYTHLHLGLRIISIGCTLGILWFLLQTFALQPPARNKQLIAIVLIIEAIVFFVIYNQMNTTLILFAEFNSDLALFNFHISPAQYQILNPILIILLGTQLPRFYKKYPQFSIPYQFAGGTLISGIGLLIITYATFHANHGLINGNYIGLTYIFISLAELLVSAIGLSMIGLYCEQSNITFAMGVWYVASSLSNTLSGYLAKFVALPKTIINPLQSLHIYQHYYLSMGIVTLILSVCMWFIAFGLSKNKRLQISFKAH